MNEVHAVGRPSETFVISAVCCPRDHVRGARCTYRVAWAINPHMRPGAADGPRARAQHGALRAALRREGARLIDLPFVHGAYDSVFAKDNAVLLAPCAPGAPPRALLARPVFGQRRCEQLHRAAELYRLGFDVHAPRASALEGGDVVALPDARGALLGYGQRSVRASAAELERFLNAPVVPLELRDARLYHLDTALAVLGDGTALVCTEAFTPAALRALARAPGVRQLVPVPTAEALAFGLNLVEIGDAVVLGTRAPTVFSVLRARGRRPVYVPLDEFQLAGGSAACLVARLHPAPGAIAPWLGGDAWLDPARERESLVAS